MSTDGTPEYLRRKASTEYLLRVWGIEIAPSTLAKKCSRRRGPATVHCGRVAMHSIEALDAFARAQLRPAPKEPSLVQPQSEVRP